jgi:hypothetical protein
MEGGDDELLWTCTRYDACVMVIPKSSTKVSKEGMTAAAEKGPAREAGEFSEGGGTMDRAKPHPSWRGRRLGEGGHA